MSDDAEKEFEVPAEQDPSAPAEAETEAVRPPHRAAARVTAGGLRVGDFVMRVVPALATDDTHDSQQKEDRARAREDDARAAQHAGAGGPVTVTGAGAEGQPVDFAQEAPEEVPILLRDPITGQPIGTL